MESTSACHADTSSQNDKAERIIRSTNNVVRSLLFQASLPPSYWVEALQTATHLLNILPTKTLQSGTPHAALFSTAPSYDHLRVFGCKCYPYLFATAPHRLSPRSALCLPGLLRSSQRILLPLSLFQQLPSPGTFSTSRPFAELCSPPSPAEFDFLNVTDYAPAPIGSVYKFLPTGPDAPPSAQPRAAAHGAPPAGQVALDALPAGSTTPDAPQASPVDSSSTALPRAAPAFSVRPRVARGPPPGFLELPPRASAPPRRRLSRRPQSRLPQQPRRARHRLL